MSAKEQMLVLLGIRLGVSGGGGCWRAYFDRFHVEVEGAGGGIAADSCIAGVG